MKKNFLKITMLICAVMILCMESAVLSFAGEAGAVLSAPVASVENCEAGVQITWNIVPDAIGYKVYRAEENEESSVLEYISGGDIDEFTDETAESGKIYTYSVRAYNIYTESELSESITHKYLSVPTVITASNGYGGIDIQWEITPGAAGYILYKKSGDSVSVLTQTEGKNAVNYLDKAVKDGEKYSYGVVAVSGEYQSGCVYKSSSVYVTAPKVTDIKNGDGYVRIWWKKTAGADKYKIYKKTGNGEWKALDTVKKSSSDFKDKNVANGKTYSYRVLAVDGKYKSGYIKDGTSIGYVAEPKSIKAENKNFNGLYVTWGKVSGAAEYKLYRKDTKNKSWSLLADVKGTSYKDKTAKNGVEYTYSVKAVGKNGGVSSLLSAKKLMCIYKPSSVKLTSTADGVKISWSKVSLGDGYRIYRKQKGKGYKLIKKISGSNSTSYTDENVTSGKTYIYTVKAMDGKIPGCYDNSGYSVKHIVPPTVKLNHSPKGIVLKWDKSPVGTGYEIQRKVEGEKKYKKYAVVNSRDTLTYTDKKPSYGKYNAYRVKVIYDKNLTSSGAKLFGIDPKKKMVALTYDDGPNTKSTNSIINTLKKYNSRATFFVVGSRVNTYKDCIIAADKIGCEIANHSYNHTIFTTVGSSKIQSEINATNKAVKNIIGKTPSLVRCPGGTFNSTVKNTVDYPLINWSVDTLDWKNRNASSVVSNIKNNVNDGSIVLMHDLYNSTAQATQEIVPWLIEKGYQIVTVSEMMAVKGVEPEAGKVYYSIG